MCKRYNEEVALITNIIPTQALGLLLLEIDDFKTTARPEPQKLIDWLKNIIPWIGKTNIDNLKEESDEFEIALNQNPMTTIEHVQYLEYVEAAVAKIDRMEAELDYCKELYDITEEFNIPVHSDDMANYLGLSVIMATLRNLVDKKIEELDKALKRFNDQMNREISALIGEVGEINDECTVRDKIQRIKSNKFWT